jgi:EAL domain-containing protein (putative c-di-GMP-specific phosphodiesterase class I)/CheY-like chemotaxis protein
MITTMPDVLDRLMPVAEPSLFGVTTPAPLDFELSAQSERRTGREMPGLLLLDDDSFMLGVQSRMLRDLGFHKISTAGSADAALILLKKQRHLVDVILCDLNMPGMDGIEFLLRLNKTGFSGGVILISGEGARIMHSVQRLLDGSGVLILGALEKPAGRAALLACLQVWRSSRQTHDAAPQPKYSAADVQAAMLARQWVLHYQPQVDLRSGALHGMEALVRWDHPRDGMVRPDYFIALAEECGMIGPLTEWVLSTALRQMARWQAIGLKLHMSINVSMENLNMPGFASRVAELMRGSSVPEQLITLEVTESRLMSPTSVPLENLVRLRMQRFGLSIDDFGTGHSSLAHLRDIPFTELKIDRGFVRGASSNPFMRPILEGSIGLASRLSMQSVAEGVETEDDWNLVREVGCDLAQGWFVGRPMPAEAVPEWVAQWRPRQEQLNQQAGSSLA